MHTIYPFEARGNYINGEFRTPSNRSGTIQSFSPANLKDKIAEFNIDVNEVDRAVEASLDAFKLWKKRPVQERFELVLKFKKIVESREEEFASLLAREVGKPLWEARTEVKGVIGKVAISIEDGLQYVADLEISEILPGTNGSMRHRPLGVMAVLGPFNFPAHLPNGHIIPALLSGNTVIFKPSEKTPAVGQFLMECFALANFPAGVINLVQGGLEVSQKLVSHEKVHGVLFTGSYGAGRAIKTATLDQPWKLLALEMGGKNSAIVWEDACIETALYETLTGAFMTSGQRCSATSKILVHRKLLDEFVSRFVDLSNTLRVGHPLDQVFMGPVIDATAKTSIQKGVSDALKAGFENPLAMREPNLEYDGYYLTPAVFLRNKMSLEEVEVNQYLQQEIFGPEVLIIGIDSLEQSIRLANATPYGLVGSIFSNSADVFETCWWELETGLVNWNKSTVGASSRLPFGGLKASGNHFPTALLAGRYCSAAITSMQVPQPVGRGADLPGLSWISGSK